MGRGGGGLLTLQQVHLEILGGQPHRVEAPGGNVAFQRWLPGQHAKERALPRAIQPQHQHLALLQLLQRGLFVLLVFRLWGTGQVAAGTLPPDPSRGKMEDTKAPIPALTRQPAGRQGLVQRDQRCLWSPESQTPFFWLLLSDLGEISSPREASAFSD